MNILNQINYITTESCFWLWLERVERHLTICLMFYFFQYITFLLADSFIQSDLQYVHSTIRVQTQSPVHRFYLKSVVLPPAEHRINCKNQSWLEHTQHKTSFNSEFLFFITWRTAAPDVLSSNMVEIGSFRLVNMRTTCTSFICTTLDVLLP